MEYVNIGRHPRLKKPVLLAAWPGVSNVALEVADYLREKLDAKEFADIDPLDFFTPVGILVHNNVVEVPVFPENKFYFVKIPKAKHDLIVFCGEAQPDQNQYELAQLILDAAQKLKVQRIYTCAAALVPHSVQKSRVLVAATDAKLIKELQKYNVMATGDFQIRGLNGLLLGAAKEREMEPYEPQPYAVLDIDDRLYHITAAQTQEWHHLGAASYDRERGLLYVFEPHGDGDKPLVHVWHVAS